MVLRVVVEVWAWRGGGEGGALCGGVIVVFVLVHVDVGFLAGFGVGVVGSWC